MTKRHTPYPEFDPFDDPEIDGFDGFTLPDDMDDPEIMWYKGFSEEHPFCEFGIGDADGLCIRDRYGCHIEGCEFASKN